MRRWLNDLIGHAKYNLVTVTDPKLRRVLDDVEQYSMQCIGGPSHLLVGWCVVA